MYRVNAERSQEKNDGNGCVQRCTKVTCATRTRRKSRVTSQLVLPCSPITLFLPHARFNRTLRCRASAVARREAARSFPRSIMRDDFQATHADGTRLQ